MVFENLTLFEIQLDGAQIGPRTMPGDDVIDEMETAETGGRGRLFGIVAFAVLAMGATLMLRRSRSTDVELDADGEDAESDLATAQ